MKTSVAMIQQSSSPKSIIKNMHFDKPKHKSRFEPYFKRQKIDKDVKRHSLDDTEDNDVEKRLNEALALRGKEYGGELICRVKRLLDAIDEEEDNNEKITSIVNESKKRGRPPSAGKIVLKEACKKRGICTSGSIKTLIQRIKLDDIKKLGQLNKTANGQALMSTTQSPNSSIDKPLHISAQTYVDDYCNGDINNSRPEWVKTVSSKICKWMKPTFQSNPGEDSKCRIRWIRAS